ncbi:MAG: hypothetical protein U0166_22625 [Acidobacteriota bacterium]
MPRHAAHPSPLKKLRSSGSSPKRRASAAVGAAGRRHASQIRRMSRCERAPTSVLASRFGSTPSVAMRETVRTASVAWSVLKTRCPVCAARIAADAVSSSRISPIRITSGFWRMNARAKAANPICGVTCFWLVFGKWYSIGSSTDSTLRSGARTRSSAE